MVLQQKILIISVCRKWNLKYFIPFSINPPPPAPPIGEPLTAVELLQVQVGSPTTGPTGQAVVPTVSGCPGRTANTAAALQFPPLLLLLLDCCCSICTTYIYLNLQGPTTRP